MPTKHNFLWSANITLAVVISLLALILVVTLSGYALSFSEMVSTAQPDLKNTAAGAATNVTVVLMICIALKWFVSKQLRKYDDIEIGN
jgi:hypothetical protein